LLAINLGYKFYERYFAGIIKWDEQPFECCIFYQIEKFAIFSEEE